jgi:hypothetical protein
MLTAEALVQTDRPHRYLVQLCKHASQMGQHRGHRPRTHDGADTHTPPEIQHTEWSDTHGIVKLNWGQWTVHAAPGTLTLRAEAIDEKNLQQIQDLLGGRLEKIGRRDHLTVAWQRPDAPTAQPGDAHEAGNPRPAEEDPQHTRKTGKRRSLTRRWPLLVGVGLFVAVHLGLGGAALAASRWTDWTAIGLVAVFLVKVVGLRLLATRRGNVPQAPRNILDRMLRNHVGHLNESRVTASVKGPDNSTHP